jgi:hypothetical protein
LLAVADAGPGFESRPAADLLAGANLLLLGDELLQFRDVRPDGVGRVRLTGLLRGRFGTAAAAHAPGMWARQLRPETVPGLALDSDGIGREIGILALGAGDPAGGTLSTRVVRGDGLAPMGPVHLQVERGADGTVRSRWVARGREAFPWAGLEPAVTAFSWRFSADAGGGRAWPVEGLSFELTPAMQVAAWGALLPAGEVRVVAVGDGPEAVRSSRPTRLEGVE